MVKNKKIEERIIRERVQLLLHYPFFGHLALGLNLKEEPGIPTMATDGENIFYNPLFVDQLTPAVLRTIIAHEVLHCGLGHLWREEKRDKTKWNHATDHAVNLMLRKEKFPVPYDALCDSKFENMGAEAIYARLPNSEPEGRLLDSHDKWPGKQKSGKKKVGEKDDDEKKAQDSSSGNKQKDLEKKWQERLVRAATMARMQGNLPGSADKLIKDLLEPKLDWKIILQDLVTSLIKNDFRLIPPSKKHLWRGIYLPSIHGKTIEIGIGIDTSGSVVPKEFQEFIAEIRGITEQFEDYILHLFFCDTEIHDRMALAPYSDWPKDFPKRSGGTSFVPVFEVIDKEEISIAALVYLTDGRGDFPKFPPDYPVIWVLNTNVKMPWGEEIRMEVT